MNIPPVNHPRSLRVLVGEVELDRGGLVWCRLPHSRHANWGYRCAQEAERWENLDSVSFASVTVSLSLF